jgi:hypothetical protein
MSVVAKVEGIPIGRVNEMLHSVITFRVWGYHCGDYEEL